MPTFAFDIETFPNFFSVILMNCKTEEAFTFVLFEDRDGFEDRDDLSELREFINGPWDSELELVGYNCISFDLPILQYAVKKSSVTTKELYDLAQTIISEGNYPKLRPTTYRIIDLIRILNLDVSLKQVAINLKHEKIQELPFKHTHIVKRKEVDILLEYNKNDVLITRKLYFKSLDDINLRRKVSRQYDIPADNSSDSAIANQVLEKFYAEETGQSPLIFKEGRTPRNSIPLVKCVGKNIEFLSSTLKSLLSDIKETTLLNPDGNGKFNFSRVVQIGSKTYDVGVGGLHSRDNPGMFESNSEYAIFDADVTSFYPNIMIANKIKPAHLLPKFLDIFMSMTEDRMEAKRKGDKLAADVLKITINSVFGKLGYKNAWLYDPLAFYSVTVSGQLYLLMLVEMMEENGIEVISANTDGITVKIPKDRVNNFVDISTAWGIKTGFELDLTEYQKYVRRDVNNYIAQTVNGKIKTKGIFDDLDSPTAIFSRTCGRKYSMPIVQKALRRHFLSGEKIEDVVFNSDSIFDFLVSHKSNKKFKVVIRHPNGKKETIQRTIRYYMPSIGGYEIIKVAGDREISVSANHCVILGNEIDLTIPIEEYSIDYGYYIKEIRKITNAIEPTHTQLSLF